MLNQFFYLHYEHSHELEFIIQFQVKENTGEHNLTAFEEVAIYLATKTMDELITLDRPGGDDPVRAQPSY
ncbi:hypothetical protein ACHQM5_009908 [Ranunculus cassubicifolius]